MKVYVLIYNENGLNALLKTLTDREKARGILKNAGFNPEAIEEVMENDEYCEDGSEVFLRETELDCVSIQ